MPRGNFEFEEWNVIGTGAWRASNRLGADRTAVAHFPGRPCVVTANCFTGDEQRRDRFAQLPSEFSGRTELALIKLCADRMNAHDRNFTRCRNCVWHFGCREQRGHQPHRRNVGRYDRNGTDQRSNNAKESRSDLSTPAEYLLVPTIYVTDPIGSATKSLGLHSTLHSVFGHVDAPFARQRL
jgi:hypothetical protein